MPKHDNLYAELLNLIKEYAKTTDKLPPEEELAEQLNISRVRLRARLAELQINGYITRKKGSGTIINHYILKETARLDVGTFYDELITESGHTPKVLVRAIKAMDNVSDEIRENLNISSNTQVYRIEKVVYADEKPVIFVTDYIPANCYNPKDIDVRLLAKSVLLFVEKQHGEILSNMIVRMEAVAATGEVAAVMELPENTPMLLLTGTFYSRKRRPVIYSVEHFYTAALPFSFKKSMTRYTQ